MWLRNSRACSAPAAPEVIYLQAMDLEVIYLQAMDLTAELK